MRLVTRILLVLIALGVWATALRCGAGEHGSESSTLLEDFEKGTLADWSVEVEDERSAKVIKVEVIDEGKAYHLTGPAVTDLEGKPNEARVQIEEVDGDAALHIQGPVSKVQKYILHGTKTWRDDTIHRHPILAVLPGFQTDTFVLELGLKGAGGVTFGGGFRVYIGQVGDIGELMYQAPLQSVRRIGTRYLTLSKWNRLKVVCTPSFIRVYREGALIGNIVIDTKQSWPARGVEKGPVALFGQDAYFDDLRASVAPSPLEASVVVPDLPEGVEPKAYAFLAAEDVTVHFGVLNYGASAVQFSLAIDEFNKASRRDLGRKSVPAGSSTPKRLAFELGRMKPGFYQMHLAFSAGGKTSGRQVWPLAVLRSMGGKKEDFVQPVLPMGPYLASMKYCRTRPPFYGNTYIRKIFDDLSHFGFNMLVECGRSLSEANLDLCQRYGIAVWDRGKPRNHPIVLGGLIGDEPRSDRMGQYVKAYKEARAERENPDQLLLTNVVADRSLSCFGNFFWDVIQPRHRLCRIYSCTGSTTTLDNLRLVGKSVSYPGQLKNIQNYLGNTPYSMLIPTFGGGTKAFYRDPTPAEVKVMMHMSLAYGAKGLFFYTWQSQGGEAFVDTYSLRPLDGKLPAAAEELRKIRPHTKLVRSLEPDSRRVYSTSPWVEAVPLRSGKGAYVYVVNRNVRTKTRAELYWDPERQVTRVFDLYAGQALQVFQAPFEGDERSCRVRLGLLPGTGTLLEVTAKENGR